MVIGNSQELRKKLLELYHDSGVGGHFGVSVTGKRLTTIIYGKAYGRGS